MWDPNNTEPCLLVVKSGVFSIVRHYFTNMSINRTSMEWAINNYDKESEVFSEPGDSGSVIADIREACLPVVVARLRCDLCYTVLVAPRARVKADGFPNANLN